MHANVLSFQTLCEVILRNDVRLSEVRSRDLLLPFLLQAAAVPSIFPINFADLQPPTPLRNFGTPPTTLIATSTMRADYLPHARVSVLVNGVALTEFSTKSGDGQGATTFIEAVPGATFSVEVELEPAFATRRLKDQIVSSIRLDGETVSGSVIYADNLPAKSMVSGVSERKNGEATLRAFVFAEHATGMLQMIGMLCKC
jgi:hypothetical protein